ncbi:MAG: methyltransferase domain-containing protein, partial [Candidatus Omnitrophica bacterium]|nr:methyltransferase domain-containing protein [Candidatus Omnitrophota bacterium]
MLEEDYLKSTENRVQITEKTDYSFTDPRLKELNSYSTELIKELIIPKLTKEVNSSKRYSKLRQVYYSLILAQWFKSRQKGLSPKGTVPDLIDSKNLSNLTSKTPWNKATYFNQYQQSFTKGEYNTKETVYTPTGQVIRSYMSGGIKIMPEGIVAAGSPLNKTTNPIIAITGSTPVLETANNIEIKVSSSVLNPINSITQAVRATPDASSAVGLGRSSLALGEIEGQGIGYGERQSQLIPSVASSLVGKIKPSTITNILSGKHNKINFSRVIKTVLLWIMLVIAPNNLQGGDNGVKPVADILIHLFDSKEMSWILKESLESNIYYREIILDQLKHNPSFRYRYFKEKRLEELNKSLIEYSLQTSGVLSAFMQTEDILSVNLRENEFYRLLKHDSKPVFFWVFNGTTVQGLAFDRLSFFVENKNGLLSDSQLDQEMQKTRYEGAFGHDFRLEDIANFFTLAAQQGVSLNIVEGRIKEELMKLGLLVRTGHAYIGAPDIAIVTCYQGTGRATVEHELNHAEYFINPDYRLELKKLWLSLSEASREFIKTFFSLYYDTGNEDLLIREFAAWFRDKQDTLVNYLEPLGKQVVVSQKGDDLYCLRTYYDAQGSLRKECSQLIDTLNNLVLSVEPNVRKVIDSHLQPLLLNPSNPITQVTQVTPVASSAANSSNKAILPYGSWANVSRGLYFEDYYTEGDVSHFIRDAQRSAVNENRNAKVLVIGVGVGKIVYDLKQAFPDIDLSFINKESIRLSKEPEEEAELFVDHMIGNENIFSFLPPGFISDENLAWLKYYPREKEWWERDAREYLVRKVKDFLRYFNDDLILHDANQELPYGEESFDFVLVAAQTFQYIKNKLELIAQVKRVLRRNSVAVINDVDGFRITNFANEDFFRQAPGNEYEFKTMDTSVRTTHRLIITNKYPGRNLLPQLKLIDSKPFNVRSGFCAYDNCYEVVKAGSPLLDNDVVFMVVAKNNSSNKTGPSSPEAMNKNEVIASSVVDKKKGTGPFPGFVHGVAMPNFNGSEIERAADSINSAASSVLSPSNPITQVTQVTPTASSAVDERGSSPGAYQGNSLAEVANSLRESQRDYNKSRSLREIQDFLNDSGVNFHIFSFILGKAITGSLVRIADIGCGFGVMLNELKGIFGEILEAYGVDLVDYRTSKLQIALEWLKNIFIGKIWEVPNSKAQYKKPLWKKDFIFIQDDMDKVIFPKKMDLITSFYALQYHDNPLNVWCHLFNQLSPGGALITQLLVPVGGDEAVDFYKNFVDILRKENIEIELKDFVVEKWGWHQIVLMAKRRGEEEIKLETGVTEVTKRLMREERGNFEILLVKYKEIKVKIINNGYGLNLGEGAASSAVEKKREVSQQVHTGLNEATSQLSDKKTVDPPLTRRAFLGSILALVLNSLPSDAPRKDAAKVRGLSNQQEKVVREIIANYSQVFSLRLDREEIGAILEDSRVIDNMKDLSPWQSYWLGDRSEIIVGFIHEMAIILPIFGIVFSFLRFLMSKVFNPDWLLYPIILITNTILLKRGHSSEAWKELLKSEHFPAITVNHRMLINNTHLNSIGTPFREKLFNFNVSHELSHILRLPNHQLLANAYSYLISLKTTGECVSGIPGEEVFLEVAEAAKQAIPDLIKREAVLRKFFESTYRRTGHEGWVIISLDGLEKQLIEEAENLLEKDYLIPQYDTDLFHSWVYPYAFSMGYLARTVYGNDLDHALHYIYALGQAKDSRELQNYFARNLPVNPQHFSFKDENEAKSASSAVDAVDSVASSDLNTSNPIIQVTPAASSAIGQVINQIEQFYSSFLDLLNMAKYAIMSLMGVGGIIYVAAKLVKEFVYSLKGVDGVSENEEKTFIRDSESERSDEKTVVNPYQAGRQTEDTGRMGALNLEPILKRLLPRSSVKVTGHIHEGVNDSYYIKLNGRQWVVKLVEYPNYADGPKLRREAWIKEAQISHLSEDFKGIVANDPVKFLMNAGKFDEAAALEIALSDNDQSALDDIMNKYFTIGSKVIFVSERLKNGQTLADWLTNNTSNNMSARDDISRNLMFTVTKMHSFGIVHLDLKPQNIWVFNNNEVALFDFESAVIITNEQEEKWNFHGVSRLVTLLYAHPLLDLAHNGEINDMLTSDQIRGFYFSCDLYSLEITRLFLLKKLNVAGVDREMLVRASGINLPDNLENDPQKLLDYHFFVQNTLNQIERLKNNGKASSAVASSTASSVVRKNTEVASKVYSMSPRFARQGIKEINLSFVLEDATGKEKQVVVRPYRESDYSNIGVYDLADFDNLLAYIRDSALRNEKNGSMLLVADSGTKDNPQIEGVLHFLLEDDPEYGAYIFKDEGSKEDIPYPIVHLVGMAVKKENKFGVGIGLKGVGRALVAGVVKTSLESEVIKKGKGHLLVENASRLDNNDRDPAGFYETLGMVNLKNNIYYFDADRGKLFLNKLEDKSGGFNPSSLTASSAVGDGSAALTISKLEGYLFGNKYEKERLYMDKNIEDILNESEQLGLRNGDGRLFRGMILAPDSLINIVQNGLTVQATDYKFISLTNDLSTAILYARHGGREFPKRGFVSAIVEVDMNKLKERLHPGSVSVIGKFCKVTNTVPADCIKYVWVLDKERKVFVQAQFESIPDTKKMDGSNSSDPIASSAVEGDSSTKLGVNRRQVTGDTKGGIDFRSLPIVTQAVSNLGLTTMNQELRNRLMNFNLRSEL